MRHRTWKFKKMGTRTRRGTRQNIHLLTYTIKCKHYTLTINHKKSKTDGNIIAVLNRNENIINSKLDISTKLLVYVL